MHEVVEHLRKHVNQDLPEPDHILLPIKDYVPVLLSKENFRELPQKDETSLQFIDGGSAELLTCPQYAVFFNRIISLHNKTIYKNEFFTIITTVRTGKVNYNIHCIKQSGVQLIQNTSIDSQDPSFTVAHERASMATIAGHIRRCAELKFATETLQPGTTLVIDGSLFTPTEQEQSALHLLKQKAQHCNSTITAVSKTCSWLTSAGQSAIAAVRQRTEKASWIYHPVANITDSKYKTDIAIAKLHPQSKYIFKVEANDIYATIAQLLPTTTDAAFLGYPYGLLMADKLARVSNIEQQHLSTKLRILLRKDWKRITLALNATNAHNILDSL